MNIEVQATISFNGNYQTAHKQIPHPHLSHTQQSTQSKKSHPSSGISSNTLRRQPKHLHTNQTFVCWDLGKSEKMFVRYFSTKPKPKMKPIELKMPPEQTQTITRVIFDIVKEHGPLTVAQTWDRVKEVGLRGLTGKSHMKVVLRWMRERQKLRLVCNHVGPHKQFLYTTWFTKSNNINPPKPVNVSSKPKVP